MGKRKYKSKQWEKGRRKARQLRTLPSRVSARVPEASVVPVVEGAHAELLSEEPSAGPDYTSDIVTPDADGTATMSLTLTEMLAQQPEQAALFHPCEGCGKVVRGDNPRCDECSAALEEVQTLSREEKVRHEQRMRRVRTGLVVTVLVTIFGTYFWFNDPRKLLDGLLPGLSGPSQETSAGEVAFAGALATPSLTVARPGAISAPVNQKPQDGGLPNIPGTATPALAVAQDGALSPTVGFADITALSLAIREATAIATDTPQREGVTAVRSATPTPAATLRQPTPTRERPVAPTPTAPRLSPIPVRTTIVTPTRTRTPLPVPTGTPTSLPATASPTQGTAVVPTATQTALPVLPTVTPVQPTITVALPTVTPSLPTVSVVPTEVRLPEPTPPGIPTVDPPSVPTVPPTLAPPTVVVPTAPAPPTVEPTVVLPTAQAPTAEVPTVQVPVVPTDLPVVATPTVLGGQHVVPTATLPVVLP
ncbi:MAG TPA: hypothetical protein VGE04_11355 [Chloroflexia bacterium]|jgi:predicted nucleic acid-binding Zn ribbon protein